MVGEDDSPRYRIQAVAARTGIPTATLRAWERRYGVPEPARSDARYRLYSERDLGRVRRMASLCAGGLRPAEAALAVRTQAQPTNGSKVDDAAADRIVAAIKALDVDALRSSLEVALTVGNAAHAYESLIAPALRRVGTLWACGELSVAHEHAATHIVRDLLSTLLRLATPPAPAPTVLLACFDEEQHELGLLGFALHVTSWGYRPLFLGARVPPRALADAIEIHRPALVGISVVIAPQTDATRALLSAYAKSCGTVPWIVGGPASLEVAEAVRRRGGVVAPADLQEVRALFDKLTRPKRRAQ
jgi:MerR family transcriptional regulator, light-induced transcriptional regulator